MDELLGVAGDAADSEWRQAAIAHAVFVAVLATDATDRAMKAHRRGRWPALTTQRARAGRFPPEHPHLARCEGALRALDVGEAFPDRMDALLDAEVGGRVTSG